MTPSAPLPPLDLRARLLAWLALGALLWLAIALLLTALTLRRGVSEESVGADALTELLILAGEAHLDPRPDLLARLDTLVRSERVRHLIVRWAPAAPAGEPPLPLTTEPPAGQPPPGPVVWLARRLGLVEAVSAPALSHSIPVGERVLLLSPDPHAEIDEVLDDSLPLMLAWLLIGLGMMAGVGVIVARALAPARELCAGLLRLEGGAATPGFGRFRLREYAAIAEGIEHMALRLGQAHRAQQRLAQRLIGLQEEERRALARDLHDELGQHLTGMAAQVALLQRHADKLSPARVQASAEALQAELRCVSQQLRQMLSQLRPHGLSAAGLPDELALLVEHWRARRPEVAIELHVAEPLPPIDDEAVLVLYRGLQEGLTNVFRHSQARQLRVQLAAGPPGELALRLVDDGCGLPPEEARSEGTGLLAMRERAARVGGRLQLAPAGGPPGRPGLALTLTVPCRAPSEPFGAEPLNGESLNEEESPLDPRPAA